MGFPRDERGRVSYRADRHNHRNIEPEKAEERADASHAACLPVSSHAELISNVYPCQGQFGFWNSDR